MALVVDKAPSSAFTTSALAEVAMAVEILQDSYSITLSVAQYTKGNNFQVLFAQCSHSIPKCLCKTSSSALTLFQKKEPTTTSSVAPKTSKERLRMLFVITHSRRKLPSPK